MWYESYIEFATLDAMLARSDRPVSGREVSALIGKAVQDVDLLETEDRDRAYGYTLEVWYILGFKGPTGQFSAGSAYPKPDGYSQPLPPVGRRRKATAHCRRKHVPIALSGTAWILHSSCATVSN